MLDLDDSTTNGTRGGYTVGRAANETTYLSNVTVLLKNDEGCITGVYKTENNTFDEGFVELEGYYRVTSPVDTNYDLLFLNNTIPLLQIENITIEAGDYAVRIDTTETDLLLRKHTSLTLSIRLCNTGDFNDTYFLTIPSVTQDWPVTVSYTHLRAHET